MPRAARRRDRAPAARVRHPDPRPAHPARSRQAASARTRAPGLRVSFSITTDREDVRRLYEPLCAPIPERIRVVRRLREAGIATYATLAPLLPCESRSAHRHGARGHRPRHHRRSVSRARGQDIRRHHARGRAAASARSAAYTKWHEPEFQAEIVERMRRPGRARRTPVRHRTARIRMAGGGKPMNVAETNAAKVEEILESLEIEPINSGACGGEWIAAPSGARARFHQSRRRLADRESPDGRAARLRPRGEARPPKRSKAGA